jgi:hypothetical protein
MLSSEVRGRWKRWKFTSVDKIIKNPSEKVFTLRGGGQEHNSEGCESHPHHETIDGASQHDPRPEASAQGNQAMNSSKENSGRHGEMDDLGHTKQGGHVTDLAALNITVLLQQAEEENATAMFMVGVCFMEGLGGLQEDEVAGFRCFLAAAQQVMLLKHMQKRIRDFHFVTCIFGWYACCEQRKREPCREEYGLHVYYRCCFLVTML